MRKDLQPHASHRDETVLFDVQGLRLVSGPMEGFLAKAAIAQDGRV